MKAGDEEHCLFKLRNPWGDARVPLIFSDLFRQKAKGAVLGRCFSEKKYVKRKQFKRFSRYDDDIIYNKNMYIYIYIFSHILVHSVHLHAKCVPRSTCSSADYIYIYIYILPLGNP